MKTWQLALLGGALLATAGCRTDPAIPILERQLRLQEDEIYRLRAKIEEYQDGDSYCPRRPEGASRSDGEYQRDEASPRSRPDRAAPNGEPKPQIDIEIPGQPSDKIPDTLKRRGSPTTSAILESDGPSLDGPSRQTTARRMDGQTRMSAPPTRMDGRTRMSGPPRASEPRPFTPAGDSRQVASIAIDRTFTGGINSGDRSGDQGLLVVVEPRDRAGRAVDAPAEMSVVVLDPAVLDNAGKAARVGRWDFTAAETAGLFRSTDSSRAVHLAMAWPAEPPRHNKLHLFVRYQTADGRRLEADVPIEVALPGQRQAGWTPAPGRRGGDEEEYSGREPGGVEQSPAGSWRPNEAPAPCAAEPPAEIATRPDPLRPERPAWSPERR